MVEEVKAHVLLSKIVEGETHFLDYEVTSKSENYLEDVVYRIFDFVNQHFYVKPLCMEIGGVFYMFDTKDITLPSGIVLRRGKNTIVLAKTLEKSLKILKSQNPTNIETSEFGNSNEDKSFSNPTLRQILRVLSPNEVIQICKDDKEIYLGKSCDFNYSALQSIMKDQVYAILNQYTLGNICIKC